MQIGSEFELVAQTPNRNGCGVGAKPIDAVVESDPNGDGARGGSSQTCSGSRRWPEVTLRMACRKISAVVRSPLAIASSPRSPPRTGHRWPEPVSVVGHGAPVGWQFVGSGS